MPQYNRSLALNMSSVTFGDPLQAGIFGSSATARMSDPISATEFAMNSWPFPYESNTFTDEKDGVNPLSTGDGTTTRINSDGSMTTTFPDGKEYTTKTSLIQKLIEIFNLSPDDKGGFSGITANSGMEKYGIVKSVGIYAIIAIVGLILIIFGLRELTK